MTTLNCPNISTQAPNTSTQALSILRPTPGHITSAVENLFVPNSRVQGLAVG